MLPNQTIAIELNRSKQAPIFISFNAIVGIYPSIMWEAPSLEIHLCNNKQHCISFANELERATFYKNITAHVCLVSHQITEFVTYW